MPSIPILTTPQRSQRRPARAPRAIGVARRKLGQQAQHLKTLSHTGPDEDAAHETEDIDAKAHGMEARRWSGKHAPCAGDEGYPTARQQGVPGENCTAPTVPKRSVDRTSGGIV